MTDRSRRSFLGLRPRASGTDEASPPVEAKRDAAPLPSVIAWLADYEEESAEPPLPRPAAHAPILRPPGAVSEAEFLARCTRCDHCIEACPPHAIAKAPRVFGAAAGTPWIDPSNEPCRLCTDFPCIAACPTDALVDEGDPMGTAWIQVHDCLNALGSTCRTCEEQCPIEGAVTFVSSMPRVSPNLCVGCGICHYACPAPQNAIAILPNAKRRTPTAGPTPPTG